MTDFVLVHGSFQGGWIWQPTAAKLRAAGHRVYTPTLDGCAERKVSLRAGITVTSVAEELAQMLFYEDVRDVVLVGTSSGGLVVEKLASLSRDRIARLVFLDALAPQPGESVRDIVQRGPNAALYQLTEFTRGPSREELEKRLFADLPSDLRAWPWHGQHRIRSACPIRLAENPMPFGNTRGKRPSFIAPTAPTRRSRISGAPASDWAPSGWKCGQVTIRC